MQPLLLGIALYLAVQFAAAALVAYRGTAGVRRTTRV
jgi:hypothetical protein